MDVSEAEVVAAVHRERQPGHLREDLQLWHGRAGRRPS